MAETPETLYCIAHNSYVDGDSCVWANTHPNESPCIIGIDPDFDPLWDLGGEG